MTMTKFFIVWNGVGSPTVRHASRRAAEDEAERLTRIHGGEFMVLQLVNVCRKNDIVWDETPDKDVPF